MKKTLFLSLCAVALAACIIGIKVYAAKSESRSRSHSNQFIGDETVYSSGGTTYCSSPRDNCYYCVTVSSANFSAFLQAVGTGSTSQFFSAQSNLQAFGITDPAEIGELQDPNAQSAIIGRSPTEVWVAFGYSAHLGIDNADFVIDVPEAQK